MAAYLAENKKSGRSGRHAYAAADFGLDPEETRAAFADYAAAPFLRTVEGLDFPLGD